MAHARSNSSIAISFAHPRQQFSPSPYLPRHVPSLIPDFTCDCNEQSPSIIHTPPPQPSGTRISSAARAILIPRAEKLRLYRLNFNPPQLRPVRIKTLAGRLLGGRSWWGVDLLRLCGFAGRRRSESLRTIIGLLREVPLRRAC